MADIIKKISAFEALPAKGVTSDTDFIVAKDNANYKLPFGNLFTAIDKYMSMDSSNITKWIKSKFASKTEVLEQIEPLATKEELIDLKTVLDNTELKSDVDNILDKLDNFATQEWANEQFITTDELDEIHQSYLSEEAFNTFKETIYTKEETQEKIDDILSKLETVNATITGINTEIETLKADVNELKSTSTDLSDLIKTDGDGTNLLGDDGKYHDLTTTELISIQTIELNNEMLDTTNMLTANIVLPKLPFKSVLNFSINISNSTFYKSYAKSVSIKTEFNNFEKHWLTNRTAFEVTFENEVLQFEENGQLSNLVRTKTYFDEDNVLNKISIRSSVLDILHDTYTVPVVIELTDKLAEDAVKPSSITCRIFGYK